MRPWRTVRMHRIESCGRLLASVNIASLPSEVRAYDQLPAIGIDEPRLAIAAGAGCADGERLAASSHDDDRFAARVADDGSAFGHLRDRYAICEIRSGKLGRSATHTASGGGA